MAGLHSASRRSRWRVGLVTAGATALLLGAGAVAAVNAQAAAGCRVIYTATSQWSGGFTANVAITNLGDNITGWSLEWTFLSGQQVTRHWNATTTQSGSQVTATNISYNAALATNATVSFGFNGSWSGSNTTPTSFTLNGVACTGVGPTSPTPTDPAPGSQPPTSPPTSQPPTSQPPAGDPMAVAAAMQPGWNVGNTMDAAGSDETAWGNPRITRDLLRTIRTQGFRSLRLPVTWSNHHGVAPDYPIDVAWLNRVKEVVDWALAEGLYVVINIHHDSWQWTKEMPTDRTNVFNRFNALWRQIAAAFRDHSQKLTFESINEPQFNSSASESQAVELLNELNTSFRNIVRQSGGNNASRLLVIPTLHTSAEQARLDPALRWFNSVNDRNLAATVHYYGYWPFSVNVAGGYRFDSSAQQDLTGTFDRVYNTFVSRRIPVILGEYGLLGFDRHTGTIEQGEKLKFFEMFGYHARARNVTTMLWDNGQHVNRSSLQWKDPELFTTIKESWATRSGTAESDLVFNSRSSPITSRTIPLNLNGTSVTAVRQGSTNLSNGSDYTVSGSQLTLTASALTRLTGNRAYGVNSQIHVHFSAGAPWRLNIITYDAPVLSNASGPTTAFTIPTQFRGDQLATMEARYDDGANAGPHDWTSYKEFDVTFRPNYDSNTITLAEDFFTNVNDGRRATLTFHFWSGTKLTYHITRSGSSVSGTTA